MQNALSPKVVELGKKMILEGLITKDQLAVAEVTQHTRGGDLASILIQKGFIQEKTLLDFFANQLKISVIELKQQSIPRSLLKFVPYHLAKKYTVIPLSQSNSHLTLVTHDPFHFSKIEAELNCGGLRFEFAIAPRQQIEAMIIDLYQLHRITSTGSEKVEFIVDEQRKSKTDTLQNVEELASSVGTVSTVNNIIETAYAEHASDIHIEPQENFIRVRLRIDGVLEEKHILNKQMLLPVVSRLKIVSGMNIAERRAPQDGRFTVKIHGEILDCRTSTYPTIHGEKVVIRLLSKSSLKKLEQLGMFEKDCETFRSWILRPHGLIFVTGPTGSGKSTTLYSALQLLNSIDRNIMSIEDPVENEVAGVNQAQLNTKANITFASSMRSMLRQDPDVIMVGEVRDAETAEMALRAALTGHLVLSTLHTNTAAGVVTRLINLGVPPFLVSSALIGALGQRLVRKNCEHCKKEYVDEAGESLMIGLEKGSKLFRGQGCERCRSTGYSSRIGLFELFTVTSSLRDLIEKGVTEEALTKEAKTQGYIPMIEDGRQKILKGLTSASEVIRVTEIFS